MIKKRINITPLSVNKAWQGRRFKTKAYLEFEKEMFANIKKYQAPEGKLKMTYTFGFSSKLSDLSNPLKLVEDILSKKYNFNDNRVYEIILKKEIVKKGGEFITFKIETI